MPSEITINIQGWDKATIRAIFSSRFWRNRTRKKVFPAMVEAGNIMVDEMKKTIITGGANANVAFVPNAPATVRKKKHARPLIGPASLGETPRQYLNSIRARSNERTLFVGVGPDPSKFHTVNNKRMDELGRILELGFINHRTGRWVPGRPHLVPTAKKMKPVLDKKVSDAVDQARNEIVDELNARRDELGRFT